MSRSKTVVTGGAGFIGSTLVRKLLEQGREVIVADDFSRGSLQNLRDLGIEASDVGLSTADPAIDLKDFDRALQTVKGAETVFHLAARIGSIDYLHGSDANELEALQENLRIDSNVFRASAASGVGRVVYASSTAVYPIHLQQQASVVLSEDMLVVDQSRAGEIDTGQSVVNPEGGYGWAKLMGEIQLGWMRNVASGIARIFNVYGENQDLVKAVHVIPSLFMKAHRYPDQSFIVWGDGQQSRDFLYVADCADALLRLEEKATSPPVPMNIGSGETVTIGTLAEKVAALYGKDIKIEYDTSRPVGPISRTAEIALARRLLGWRPRTSLDDGLARNYAWIRGRLGST